VRPWDRTTLDAAVVEHLGAARNGAAALTKRTLLTAQQAFAEASVHGIPGGAQAPAAALALAREADRFAAEGRVEEALEVAEVAAHAAPDDADVAERLAHARFTTTGLAAVGDLPGVLARAWHQPVRRGDIVVRAVAVLVFVVLALLVVLAASAALPTLANLGFDLWLVFLPRSSHRVQGFALALILAAVPIVVGAGLVPTTLWWLTLGFPYLAARTKGVVGFVGLLAACLPLLVEFGARGAVVVGGEHDRLEAALYDVEGAGDLARQALRDTEAKRELSLVESAALAAADRRAGRTDAALERWKVLAQRYSDQGWVHGGYGVALGNAGRDEGALGELNLCVERAAADPAVVASCAFNAAMLHARAGHGAEADAAVAGLTKEAPLLAEMRRATFRDPDEEVQHNRAFVDVLPPRRALLEGMLASSAASEEFAAALVAPLWRGGVGGKAVALLALFPLAWVVLAMLAPRLRPSCPCERCGSPASRRIDAVEVPERTCSACFHVFLSKKSRVDPSVKLQKEREILRRGQRRGVLVVALGVIPGAAHLFAGGAVRGVLLAGTSALAAGCVVTAGRLLPGPGAPGPWSALLVAGLPLLLLLALLVTSVRGALALAADERAGGRR
jgi:tetratricopeptide (TPR) repeat protein